jgi:hypothetical protein
MYRAAFAASVCLLLAACEAPVNGGDYVEILVVNSTGPSNVVVTVSDGGDLSSFMFRSNVEPGARHVFGTDIQTAGEPVHFHVEVGDQVADHTCHVHADAVLNPDNVPTAVIYSDPLRVVCQSGWQEEEA